MFSNSLNSNQFLFLVPALQLFIGCINYNLFQSVLSVWFIMLTILVYACLTQTASRRKEIIIP